MCDFNFVSSYSIVKTSYNTVFGMVGCLHRADMATTSATLAYTATMQTFYHAAQSTFCKNLSFYILTTLFYQDQDICK